MHVADPLIRLALAEDLGPGDVTTDALIPRDALGEAVIWAKEKMVLAGLDVACRVFELVDPLVTIKPYFGEGDYIDATSKVKVATVEGPLRSLLYGERTALNFLQRLSGIATWVRYHVEQLPQGNTRLVDTRKTTPGWRILEKAAVRLGGGVNHRFGLFDGVLIKDNHITACGGLTEAVQMAQANAHHLLKIEVEVATLEQVHEALEVGADIIMLDNMDLETMTQALKIIDGRAFVEVSGNVTRSRLAELAEIGVDIISMGALTHSAIAVDLSMKIVSATSANV